MSDFPQLLLLTTVREGSHLVMPIPSHGPLSPPASPADGAPACLLTPKPAALAVVFPALLQSFLTGANTIPDPWSPLGRPR
jgi:hypothetical protein